MNCQRLCELLLLVLMLAQVAAFAPQLALSSRKLSSEARIFSRDPSRFAISFSGDSSYRTRVELPHDEPAGITLDKWLSSDESDQALLGAEEYSRRTDGNYNAHQPRVAWFGLDLQPVFVNDIQRQTLPSAATKVTVGIVDAQTKISSNSKRNRVVEKLMQKSNFSGNSVIQANKISGNANTATWDLNIQLQLQLKVDLPPFLPLPPGFNTIGSSIMKKTGEQRTQDFLDDLASSYRTWASKKLSAQARR